jgi:hypothetical protein
VAIVGAMSRHRSTLLHLTSGYLDNDPSPHRSRGEIKGREFNRSFIFGNPGIFRPAGLSQSLVRAREDGTIHPADPKHALSRKRSLTSLRFGSRMHAHSRRSAPRLSASPDEAKGGPPSRSYSQPDVPTPIPTPARIHHHAGPAPPAANSSGI